MKPTVEINQSLNQTLTVLVSAIIHAALMVGVCSSASVVEKKSMAVPTKLIELKTVKPQPQPPSPKPPSEPKPQPQPPQPQPQPPKPEPKPQPQPPKPEPKPPKPEPKPQPPKPAEVKPPPPKPAVVDKPKPTTKPEKKLTPQEDFMARFNNAPTKKMDNPPPRPQPQPYTQPKTVTPKPSRSEADYERIFTQGISTAKAVPSSVTAASEIETDYANAYVNQILYNNWNISRAGMSNPNPSAVEIAFTVMANGAAVNVQVTRRSNEPKMNSSVDELIRLIKSGQIRFTPLKEAGINLQSLRITVTMMLDNK